MNARNAVLALVSIKPQPLRRLVKRLPYAAPTLYNAVSRLESEGFLRVHDGLVMPAETYSARKLAQIYIQCLIHGIDPEFVTRTSTISVWRALESSSTVKGVAKITGLSALTVKKCLSYLKAKGLVEYRKRKPIVAAREASHPLFKLLSEYLAPEKEGVTVIYPGAASHREVIDSPENVERLLVSLIDNSLSIKETGFQIKGAGGKVVIIESVEHEPTFEELFMDKLFTTEGVEEYCILLLKQGLVDFGKLQDLASRRDAMNVVGCYLDILRSMDGKIVTKMVIRGFEGQEVKKRREFLSEERAYGKQGWEEPFEKRWNLDIYLDLGAIRHGLGSS